MQNYYVSIMGLILTKLQKSKAESSLHARFVRLYHFISAKADQGLGTDFFIQIVDQIQSG